MYLQGSVISYLAPRVLARIIQDRRVCFGATNQGLLRRPSTVTHFGDVKPWAIWGPTSLRQNHVAVAATYLGNIEATVRRAPREERSRYPGPHSCAVCARLCCAAHDRGCGCVAGDSCRAVMDTEGGDSDVCGCYQAGLDSSWIVLPARVEMCGLSQEFLPRMLVGVRMQDAVRDLLQGV
jgi:hypothetical protein